MMELEQRPLMMRSVQAACRLLFVKHFMGPSLLVL